MRCSSQQLASRPQPRLPGAAAAAAAAAVHAPRRPARAAAGKRLASVPRAAAQPPPATAPTPADAATPTGAVDIQERIAFLQQDLTHLFDDRGVDASQYDDVVTFLDPITKYDNVQGYMFNIRMLKTVFSPTFELHDIRQTGPLEVTTRWTMTMKFTPAKLLPGLSRFWDPNITFTGTSAYGFNPANGKINRHIDTWDSISNQAFFSLEAFADFWRQLLATYTTPDLDGPSYTLLRRTAAFEVRRYSPFTVASTPLDNMPSASGGTGGTGGTAGGGTVGAPYRVNPASAGMQSFNALAGYIFGQNEAGSKMAMTTPVFSNTDGEMQFVLGGSKAGGAPLQPPPPSALPAPRNTSVSLQQQDGGVYAAAVFSGVAFPRQVSRVAKQLLADLDAARLVPEDREAWSLARYNDPGVAPPFRRNEVLIKLKEFDLWQ